MRRKKRDNLSFSEHLEELRWRLIRVGVLLFVLTAVSFPLAKPVLHFLIRPLGEAVFLSPLEPVLIHLKLALFIGMAATFPYWVWEMWSFAASGLHPYEKRYFFLYFPFALVSFATGIAVAFFVVLPLCLRFFLAFGTEGLVPMISIGKYISFVSGLLLSFGLVFECPVAALFLSHVGVLTPSTLLRKWRYILVFIFILGAILTPPDVLSQILLVIPILGLYGISILTSRIGTILRQGRGH